MYICVLPVILAFGASNLFAGETRGAEASLDRASYFANLYNWTAAAPYFTDAKEQFTRTGDQRNALYATFGETRATIERRNLLRTAAELQGDLDGNKFLQSDKGLRLFCLIIKGDVDIEINSRAARNDWEQVRALAAETGDARWQNRALAQIGVAAFYDGDSEVAGRDIGTALGVATKTQDRAAQIRFTTMLGIGFLETSMYERSQPYFDHALELTKTFPMWAILFWSRNHVSRRSSD